MHFKFKAFVQRQIGLCYFDIELVKDTTVPLCLLKNSSIIKCVFLPTTQFVSNEYYYTAISNNWLTLNKYGIIKVLDEFEFNN